jgi:DNA-binding IclR family transcriptional regulator
MPAHNTASSRTAMNKNLTAEEVDALDLLQFAAHQPTTPRHREAIAALRGGVRPQPAKRGGIVGALRRLFGRA